ncbi:MAG: GntR family transcriptional regulator [Phycisphaerae bacterium]|nr:GntR family transcriptional regulator [Phycisphaerae bacterium]
MHEFNSGQALVDTSAPVHRYRQVKEIIRGHVRSKEFQPGRKLESLTEMARLFQVSRATVAKATSELISEGILYSKVGSGTFVAESAPSKPGIIAVLIPAQAGIAYGNEILWNIEKVAHKAQYDVVICNTNNDLRKVDSYLEKFLRSKPVGVIYVPVSVPEGYYKENIQRIHRLQNAGIKVVLCDRNFLNIPDAIASFSLDCVYSDDISGSSKLIQHLLDDGRKRIALISGPVDSNVENRIVGYRQVLFEKNIPYRSELVKFVESYSSDRATQAVHAILDELMELTPRPDAIFAVNDTVGRMVLSYLSARKIPVPREVAVVGYDNYEWGQFLDPPLTTVDRDNTEMGEVAMELLLERIAGQRTTPRHVALPTKLIVRESCGSQPKKNKQTYITTPDKRQKEAMPMIT